MKNLIYCKNYQNVTQRHEVSKYCWKNGTSRLAWQGCRKPSICKKFVKNKSVKLSKVKVKVKSLSCVRLFATAWTVAHQAPLSMGFSRQEYWSGLPFPSPGNLPNPGIEPRSPALQADALTSEPPGKRSKMSYAYVFVSMTSKVFTFFSVIILCRELIPHFQRLFLKEKKLFAFEFTLTVLIPPARYFVSQIFKGSEKCLMCMLLPM